MARESEAHRRSRQLRTLKRALADVEDVLAVLAATARTRELTAAETLEAESLALRCERLQKSIDENGG